MKTHREQFVEILQTRDDPEGGQNDTARVSHLLLLCDMLDEREADQFRDATKLIETPCHCQWEAGDSPCPLHGMNEDEPTQTAAPTSEPQAFPDELVKRLLVAFDNGRDGFSGPVTFARGIRAVLSELAKAPVDLPSGEQMVDHVRTCMHSGINREDARAIRELVQLHVAPVLAAKDVRIESLERDHSALYHETAALETQVAEQAKRIAELEKQVSDESAYDSDLTIENRKMQTQIEVLEKRIAGLKTRVVL